MNKHTKGPWRVDALGHVAKTYEDKTNSYSMDIAIVADTPSSLGKPDLANARLIAAAPELLEALEDIVKFYSDNIKIMPVAFQTFADLAEQTINKAKGE